VAAGRRQDAGEPAQNEREHLETARLSFNQKLSLARALGLRKAGWGEWDLIVAINSLRNEVAHNLTSPKRATKMARVLELYSREAANLQGVEEIKAGGEVAVLYSACGHCVGFLSALAADSRALRGFIFTLDRSLNPDLPPFEM
jgi:hypothetical protein